jgi:hypothetical protein
MISIEHHFNVFQTISQLIMADKYRDTQFTNGTKKKVAHLVFGNDSGLVSGWSWIPVMLGLICEIKKISTELLPNCESNRSLKGIIMNLVENEIPHSERRTVW